MVDGKYAFNLSLCLFEPNTINSVLVGLSLSLLADIHSFISFRHLFNFSNAADEYFGIDGYRLECHLHNNETLLLCIYQ